MIHHCQLLHTLNLKLSHYTPCRRLGRALVPGKGGWVGLRAVLDTEVRGKFFCICRGSKRDVLVVHSAVRHYTD
jgi:hypothetical protein